MNTLNANKNEKKQDEKFAITLITTFSTVFIAELGDKTQVATLLLSAESGHPLIVFIGAALALIISSLLGVLLGKYISNRIPSNVFELLSGTLMILIGFWLLIDTFLFKSSPFDLL
ncbi:MULTISPECIES: TMEM165/GDT1 family protein [Prochlorococcus]|uniref:TMEM165/GDT1 family protein n=1 Tax=Prochlorococcus TaxID=1218 RepID=UPI000533B2B4|nr:MULTISPECIES: TMEM165/GDT1 family protein [Prochlorococcus]KGG12441.1 hypothetical protein EV05_1653 [Prochlorococcus sp. MIT 0601]